VKKADIVIESFEPGYLQKLGCDTTKLSDINQASSSLPSRASPIGPYRDYKSSDLTIWSWPARHMSPAILIGLRCHHDFPSHISLLLRLLRRSAYCSLSQSLHRRWTTDRRPCSARCSVGVRSGDAGLMGSR
jgi:hypothetical protein